MPRAVSRGSALLATIDIGRSAPYATIVAMLGDVASGALPAQSERDGAGFFARLGQWYAELSMPGKIGIAALASALVFIVMFLIIGDGSDAPKEKAS